MRPALTLGDALRSAARHAPGDAALVGDGGTLTWAALAENVDRVAATLRALVAADGGAFEGTPRGAGEGAIEGRRTGGAAPRPHAVALRPDRDDVIVLLAHAVAGIPLLPLHPALPEADAARLAATKDSLPARLLAVSSDHWLPAYEISSSCLKRSRLVATRVMPLRAESAET